MNYDHSQNLNTLLGLLIVIFTGTLAYFAFVYYPQALRDYQAPQLATKPLVPGAGATLNKFPIESAAFRITYEQGSDSYYAFVAGNNLASYLENKNSAQIALKNALSSESLCTYNVVFVSSANLEIPLQYKTVGYCQP